MVRVFQQHLAVSTRAVWLADMAGSFAAILLAALTLAVLPAPTGSRYAWTTAMLAAASFALLIPLSCALVGLYRQDPSRQDRRSIAARTLLAVILGCLLIDQLAQHWLTEPHYVDQLMPLAAAYLVLVLLLTHAALQKARRSSVGVRRILIVGTSALARALAADLRSRARAQFCVVGFYPAGQADDSAAGRSSVFSAELRLPDIVKRHRVDEIIVAADEQRGGCLPLEQLLSCRVNGTPVLDTAGFYEQSLGELPLDGLRASALVYGPDSLQQRTRGITQRAFDLVCASALLLLLAPLLAVVAGLIKLDGRGPVWRIDERVGIQERRFQRLRFRTTAQGRFTRWGRTLRRTGVHKLPQLINVLMGQMSMVGPRAERPDTVHQWRQQLPFYAMRHSVKPGLTGWAQARGAALGRGGKLDRRQQHQLDLYYIKHGSLSLDLQVLIEATSRLLFR